MEGGRGRWREGGGEGGKEGGKEGGGEGGRAGGGERGCVCVEDTLYFSFHSSHSLLLWPKFWSHRQCRTILY